MLKGGKHIRCAECPDSFTHIPSVNGCYKLVTRRLNWVAAGLGCRSLHRDAHLLVVNDAVEQLAVAGMLESTSIYISTLPYSPVYTKLLLTLILIVCYVCAV